VILLCGIPSEPPVAMLRAACERAGIRHEIFDQRAVADMAMRFAITPDRGVEGALRIGGRTIPLGAITGVYLRLTDDTRLPSVRDLPADAPLREHSRRLHETLTEWTELTSSRVANRISAMASNNSKPYQAQLIARCGFAIPDTLVTDDPAAVVAFRRLHPTGIVYKSISGIRSIVTRLEDDDLERLGSIRWCPVQFQGFVEGFNVRVHVVGSEVLATAIHTTGDDYRYAHRDEGGETTLTSYALADDVAQASVALAAALGLDFAGIDLKMAPDGAVYCFEVNPSPAYSYYESHTGQPIADTVARYLAGG
jgi:glutathione synthase/RimK-type ligase-like ATP-grasp enzyme